jgi:hypothetical protein
MTKLWSPGEARKRTLVMVLPWARRRASESQMGKSREGLMQRNWRSRFRMRWVSSQARRRGPRVEGRGPGSRIVR